MKHNKPLILSAFSIIAVLFFILENFLPKPLPFFRIGLANIFVLLIMIKIDLFSALIVSLSKIILGNLFSGLLFTPVILFSLLSSLVALLAMYLSTRSKIGFSLIGISIIGALFHNITQLGVAYVLLIRNARIFTLFPIMVVLALITGIITGFIATILNNKLQFDSILHRETSLQRD
ncbi:MAG: Gx transporter family protein [Candidatus Cloacimonetes bacterium]|nr:Gx transporter family protein [Candidatus Cloacimonadota bacterium]